MQELLLLIQNNLYRLEVCHHAKTLRFLVSDKDHAYSEKIGEVKIMAGSLLSGDRIEGKDAKNKFNLCKGAFNYGNTGCGVFKRGIQNWKDC